ncbi:polysaccharide biosynthesis tyrosine autokinase [Conexibacter woesei]|uniref:non-specific protein-tyrosine kinase n=1 Tax=Conexibacter woesei (strain DSM 14684 / CCUG 47730 / CIP 108061 / JCM 11494 / NBRC 100937 / ID131577) TaxID=469383 RepID=D3FFB7_CONWI|nr:polysaccharide biosynthesis tyrosine autokinase [Conexibacter woesei]ADB53710.1 capsular exopolysaccharide family [Conexibacter woesei DSM 14684]
MSRDPSRLRRYESDAADLHSLEPDPAPQSYRDPLGRPLTHTREQSGGGALRTFAALVRRRWLVIVLCTAVAGVGTYVLTNRETPKYSATTTLLFRDPGLSSELFGGSAFSPSTDPMREAATNLKLVTSGEVAEATARAVGNGVTAAQVAEDVRASGEGNSDLVSVTATDPDPARSAAIANEYARQFIAQRREADRSKVLEARDLVVTQLDGMDTDSPEAENLRRRADELLTLAALQTGNAEIVQLASTPTEPSSPRVKRTTMIGAAFGLLIGLGIALLLEQLDRRLRSIEQVEDLLEAPILGTVPENRSIGRSIGDHGAARIPELEPFDTVRTNLRYLDIERPISSVLVTSAQPNDGKTTVAWNVAEAAARSGASVLLIEADLRRPGIAAAANLQTRVGLSSVLANICHIEDAIVELPGGDDVNESYALDVLPAGPSPPNPLGLLESSRMRQLIADLKTHYDLIVIDTPPIAAAADAIPLIHDVDGVLAVVRLGNTRREALVSLRNQFANVGAPLLGAVINGGKPPASYLDSYRGYQPS